MEIVVAKEILKANDLIAVANRMKLDEAGVFAVNLLGSPGAGKTTLIEGLAKHLDGRVRIGVIEGDLETAQDSQRIEALGLPAVQINTGGGCHLDANMVSSAIKSLDLDSIDLLFIDNVGNLICTAGFVLGEHHRIVVLSVTEGDDKVTKYPPMFQRADTVVVNKMDLVEFTDFSLDRVRDDERKLNPQTLVHEVSATRGDGLAELADLLVVGRQAWIDSSGA